MSDGVFYALLIHHLFFFFLYSFMEVLRFIFYLSFFFSACLSVFMSALFFLHLPLLFFMPVSLFRTRLIYLSFLFLLKCDEHLLLPVLMILFCVIHYAIYYFMYVYAVVHRPFDPGDFSMQAWVTSGPRFASSFPAYADNFQSSPSGGVPTQTLDSH